MVAHNLHVTTDEYPNSGFDLIIAENITFLENKYGDSNFYAYIVKYNNVKVRCGFLDDYNARVDAPYTIYQLHSINVSDIVEVNKSKQLVNEFLEIQFPELQYIEILYKNIVYGRIAPINQRFYYLPDIFPRYVINDEIVYCK